MRPACSIFVRSDATSSHLLQLAINTSLEERCKVEMESQRTLSEDGGWRRVYQNNKGAVLILFAEAVATSMDAIVRWLQQGGRSMHPYQVSSYNDCQSGDKIREFG